MGKKVGLDMQRAAATTRSMKMAKLLSLLSSLVQELKAVCRQMGMDDQVNRITVISCH